MCSVYCYTLHVLIVIFCQDGPFIFGPSDLLIEKIIFTKVAYFLGQFCFATPFYLQTVAGVMQVSRGTGKDGLLEWVWWSRKSR